MMITESDRTILIAILAGFLSGLCQSLLKYFVDKNERHYRGKQFVVKLLYSSFSLSIIFGLMVFGLSVWDISMTTANLNRYTIAIASYFAIVPIQELFFAFVFSQFKQIRSTVRNESKN